MLIRYYELHPTPSRFVALPCGMRTSSRGIERGWFRIWETFPVAPLRSCARERGHDWSSGSIAATTSAGLRLPRTSRKPLLAALGFSYNPTCHARVNTSTIGEGRFPYCADAHKMGLRCEEDKSNLRWPARRISRRHRDDSRDVFARCAGSGNTARDHRRSPFGFHSAWSLPFAYGQGGRLQSPEATGRWIDDSWSTRCWRNCRSDLWIVLARQSCASFSALDHVRIRFVADRCVCNRALVGFGHELHWPADRRCASGHARRFRPVRFCVRTNTGGRISISNTTRDRRSGLRIQSGDRTPCFCSQRDRSCGYGGWDRVGSEALSCRDL